VSKALHPALQQAAERSPASLMASKRSRTGLGETDRLIDRIRALIRLTNARDGGNDALLRAQRLEIDRLKSELAESVKQNPTGSGTHPDGLDPLPGKNARHNA
jgi:hypothetical protein